MSVDYLSHSLLALWSLILGCFLGFVYEFFRLLHRFHPRAMWLIFFEDLLFAMICSAGMMLLFFNLSFGRMRFFAFPGMILGFLIWYFTLGRVFRRGWMLLSRLLHPPIQVVKCYIRTKMCTVFIVYRGRCGFGVGRLFKRRSGNATSKNKSGG